MAKGKKRMAKKARSAKSTKFSMNHLILVALIFGVLGGLLTWAALAAKPGTGGGGSSTAVITASPNPAAANGTRVNLSGCGYNISNGPVSVQIAHSAGTTQSFYIGLWSTGCLDNAYFTTQEAGTYTITTYQKSSSKRNATNQLKASTVLQVQ